MAKGANNFRRRFDWRDRALYDYTNRFTDRGWAWEGLRRNREFQAAWQQARSGFDWNRLGRRVTVVRADGDENALYRWGVLYSDPPDIDARNAAVVWQAPSVRVLNSVALPSGAPLEFGSFRLKEVRCSTLVLLAPDGFQHVLFYGRGAGLQLKVSGASVLEPVHLVADIVPNIADVKAHLRAQALFSELRTCGQPAFSESVPQRRADRLRMVLQALDGYLADASWREIGAALFGAGRVDRDWEDGHRHLKDRVRRAVARGRWLMEGGYRKYLK